LLTTSGNKFYLILFFVRPFRVGRNLEKKEKKEKKKVKKPRRLEEKKKKTKIKENNYARIST